MLHGDISNQRSFVIGVRCEETLFHIHGGLPKFSFNITRRFSINEEVLSIMKYLYYNTEMTVVLVIDKELFERHGVEEYLLDFPASQNKVILKSISEVTMMLNTGELTYFITDRENEKEFVNSSYAVSSKEFQKYLKREVKRF